METKTAKIFIIYIEGQKIGIKNFKKKRGEKYMALDMEEIYGNEEYEELQEYFEHRKFDYGDYSGNNPMERLEREYTPDIFEMEERYERKKVDYRQQALRRILARMEKNSSNCSQPSVSKAK